jgi:predicted TIM-barrel fold metal-dependent hydrolase
VPTDTGPRDLQEAIDDLRLVDHHVHGVLRADARPDRSALEGLLTESDRPVPPWMTQFDSQVGLALRRWCAPVLGLEPHASPEQYLERREALGPEEVTARLLRAAGISHYLIDTGHDAGALLDVSEMAVAAAAETREVVRLEAVAERLATSGVTAADFPARYPQRLAELTVGAVGVKSILAYRHGFDIDPERPSDAEVMRAAGRWLRAGEASESLRVDDPVLLRFLLWSGIDRGLPVQLHTGYGDPDLRLDRCDPLLLTPWIKAVEPHGVDLLLLHCYPYHRHAGYLAQMFPHVYFDVGLATHFAGARSVAVVAESLELAPFAKILFSTDAWGLPELHHLGAVLWRRALQRVLGQWVVDDDWAVADAVRVARMVGQGNARRVYGLDEAER